jgi:predicted amidohydrolase YtcJ
VLLIKQAEVYVGLHATRQTRPVVDVRCRDGKIADIQPELHPVPAEIVVDARGGALLPGLHDHHMHLIALAAARQSVECGPPIVDDLASLAKVLREVGGSGWIRGVGYHESVAGMLHRSQLDELVSDRPVRIQHRSGKMWFLNSTAVKLLRLDQHRSLSGIESDTNGVPTGRLFRLDHWLAEQLTEPSTEKELPDIQSASQMLASFGVTGITDATPRNSSATQALFARLIDNRQLLQRVRMLGDSTLTHSNHPLIEGGALKILLDDYALPEFEELKQRIAHAHEQGRCVAIHCVTTVELLFALSVLDAAGVRPGDRIEHASVTPDDTIPLILDAGVTLVTQPNFIAERGDQYFNDIALAEHRYLYRCKSFLSAGIPLGGGTDAPFGNPDPWRAMSAAVNRHTSSGKSLGESERLSPEEALHLFITPSENPGEKAGTICVDSMADLCILDRPWQQARLRLQHGDVVTTIRAGEIVYQR